MMQQFNARKKRALAIADPNGRMNEKRKIPANHERRMSLRGGSFVILKRDKKIANFFKKSVDNRSGFVVF